MTIKAITRNVIAKMFETVSTVKSLLHSILLIFIVLNSIISR